MKHPYALAVGLVLAGSAPAGAELYLTPHECGACHDTQYQDWGLSMHSQNKVHCNDCHGTLHSSQILGCRQCHGNKHQQILKHWPEVQRFDIPNSNDFVCVLCHDVHTGELIEYRQSCTVCHNDGVSDFVVAMHTGPGEFMNPTENDGFQLMNAPTQMFAKAPAPVKAAVAAGGSLAAFLLGAAVFFPLALGLTVLRNALAAGDR